MNHRYVIYQSDYSNKYTLFDQKLNVSTNWNYPSLQAMFYDSTVYYLIYDPLNPYDTDDALSSFWFAHTEEPLDINGFTLVYTFDDIPQFITDNPELFI